MFSFCTDDKHIEDIAANGHISWNIRKAITLGMKPADAAGPRPRVGGVAAGEAGDVRPL